MEERMNYKGKLVVICGVDGAGKTTLLNSLKRHLEEKDNSVFVTKQPTDDYRKNKFVREYLNNGSTKLSLNSLALLAASDRMIHIETEIIPRLLSGEIVLCDRYTYSTFAYFKARKADMSFVKNINRMAMIPDAGVFLHIDSGMAIERIIKRDGDTRKFEEKSKDFLDEVQNNFWEFIPNFFLKLDSGRDIASIESEAIEYVDSIIFGANESVVNS